VRHERLQHGDQSVRREFVDGLRAPGHPSQRCRDCRGQCGTTSYRRSSSPPRSRPRWSVQSGRRIRTPHRPAPPRLTTRHHLVLERTQPAADREDVRGREHTVDTGSASVRRSRSSRSSAVHRGGRERRQGARAGWSPRRIISRPLPRMVGRVSAGLPGPGHGARESDARHIGDGGVIRANGSTARPRLRH